MHLINRFLPTSTTEWSWVLSTTGPTLWERCEWCSHADPCPQEQPHHQPSAEAGCWDHQRSRTSGMSLLATLFLCLQYKVRVWVELTTLAWHLILVWQMFKLPRHLLSHSNRKLWTEKVCPQLCLKSLRHRLLDFQEVKGHCSDLQQRWLWVTPCGFCK